MTCSDEPSGLDSELRIKCGNTYFHSKHEEVEVTGIWKGVQQIDTIRPTDENGVIIVRYSTDGKHDGEDIDEFTDTLSDFVEKLV